MAQTVEYWSTVIKDKIAATPALAVLVTSFSNVGIWVLFTDCVAWCAWTLDKLFDAHRTDVGDALLKLIPLRKTWYRQKCLDFQYGFNLIPDGDTYDNTGVSDADLLASKIVTYAAVTESETLNTSKLLIKIAGGVGGALQPLTGLQLGAFRNYIQKIKGAGTAINIVNYLPDRLYLTIQIYYNPLVLDANGNSILNGGKPVETALNAFLLNLPFNGELILAALVDALQQVEGVEIPNVLTAATSWIDPVVDDYGTPTPINVKTIPVSGYLTIVNFDDITYIPNV